jgi:hypothetical protein
MQLPWLPLTSQGFMVGDYMTTAFVTGSTGSRGNGGQSTLAFPIFMIASAPTAPDTTCSNDTSGAPGKDCNQPTFTLASGVKIGGGPNQAEPALGAPAGSASNGFQFQIPEERHFHRAQTVN